MDIDDNNDIQDQNLQIVGEGSSKVSPVSHSYSLPKFQFDDSLPSHLRFDNLVDNEDFQDNNWIEEYSTAVKSTQNNVWSEATTSESVEMLLKSVGQEEKVLEETNTHSIVTCTMDTKDALESVVLGDKNNSSAGDDITDNIRDDVNQEASKIATESLVNELQEDSSVLEVECGNRVSTQNVETASGIAKNDCNNDADCINNSNENKMDSTNSNVESVDKPLVEGVNNQLEISEGTEINNNETAEITDINAVGAAFGTKNVEEVTSIAQADSNLNVITDAVEVVESSKRSFPDTADGVQLPSVTVATSDIVTEDQPRSPILGVSLLSNDNKEKTEVGVNSEGTFQKLEPEVEKDAVADGDEKFVHLNAGQSQQTGEDDSGSLPDPKESMKGEGAKPLNLAVNMSNQQQASVDVADPSENATLSSSGTKDKKAPTIEVNASTSQNVNLSKNMVSSVSTHGSQLDPIKLHEDSPVSQPPTASKAGVKRNSARKPRKSSVETETSKQSNNLKEKTPAKRSRKVEKSPTLSTPSATDMTPIPISNLPVLNNSTALFHQSFTDNQQVQLRAQILVYGSVLSGIPPEEPHMIAAFGQSDGGRKAWEATWLAYLERARGHKAQPNSPALITPSQGVIIGSAQNKILPSNTSATVNPIIPVSSPLWNIPTPSGGGGGLQSNPMPKSNLFDPFQTPGLHNFAAHNPMWPSQGPFPGPWVASSPVASFNARFSSLPITESIKLTTVKESGAPSMPVIPIGPNASQTVSTIASSGQTSSGPKSRKRKKDVISDFTTSAGQPILGQPIRVDQNIGQIVTKDNIVSKIEESKVEAADAAVHAAAAVNHCQNVWSQLKSQTSSGLVSDDEAKLASSAVSIAAASSVAKVAAAAAKIASNVAEQARLMADEVLLSNRTESQNQSNTSSIISAAKEAARRRIEAASASSKHAENLDAIVKAAELAAEAVAQAGKIVAIGNPLSLTKLIEAGPEGYWKLDQLSSQHDGHSDKQNLVTAVNDSNLSKTDVDQIMPQSTSGTWNDNIIKEGCLVEVRKESDKKKSAWFAANALTLKDAKVFVCYTELVSDDGSGKLKEWVPLEAEDTAPPRIRVAHPITTTRSEGTRKRTRTTLTDHTWCSGDRVDVWVQDCWCDAVVVEMNKIDLTSLVVQFPDHEETSVVRSWHVRPSLIWKDGKWVEWSSLKGFQPSEGGDTPNEKRHKIGSPIVEGKDKAKSSNNANIVESSRLQESKNIPLSSSQGSSLTLGQSGRNENKSKTLGTIKGDLQKKQSRVVFGVPKPGKKQKFINMSTRGVDDKNNNNNKNNTSSDSVQLVVDLTPQPSGAVGSISSSKTDAKEKQGAEVKPRVNKSRKPPVPTVKSLAQKEKSKPSKPTSHDASRSDENVSGQPNMTDVDSSNTEAVNETAAAEKKSTKVEVKDRSTSETEPRRSVRRIQPTSRLLEGLQSSLTVSHVSPRNHNKVTSKGSSNSS